MPAPVIHGRPQVTDRDCRQQHAQKKNCLVTENLVRHPFPSSPPPVIHQGRSHGKHAAGQRIRRKKQSFKQIHDQMIRQHRHHSDHPAHDGNPKRVLRQLLPLERTHSVTSLQPIRRTHVNRAVRLPSLDHPFQQIPLRLI